MNSILHPFVGELVRWFDADVCDIDRRFATLLQKDRFALVLFKLQDVGIAKAVITDDRQQRWMPTAQILARFGDAKFDFVDTFELSETPPRAALLGRYHNALGQLWRSKGEAILYRSVAAFMAYSRGFTCIVGRKESGEILWNLVPSRALDDVLNRGSEPQNSY